MSSKSYQPCLFKTFRTSGVPSPDALEAGYIEMSAPQPGDLISYVHFIPGKGLVTDRPVTVTGTKLRECDIDPRVTPRRHHEIMNENCGAKHIALDNALILKVEAGAPEISSLPSAAIQVLADGEIRWINISARARMPFWVRETYEDDSLLGRGIDIYGIVYLTRLS